MNRISRNYFSTLLLPKLSLLLLTIFISTSASLNAQEYTNVYVTYSPSGNGYEVEMNFDWIFSDCSVGNSINLGIKFNPAKSSSSVYIYEGERYALSSLGVNADLSKIRSADLVGDVFDGSWSLGRIDMRTVTTGSPNCFQFSYSVTESLRLSYKDYKGLINKLNLMNVAVIDAATTDLDIENKIKEKIKKNAAEAKIVIADKLYYIGHYEEAKIQYKNVLKIEPSNEHAKKNLKEISKMEVEKEIEPLITNADKKFSGQQYSEAEKLYNEVLTKDAENEHAKNKLEEINKINESSANLEQIKQHIKNGDAYLKSKDYQKAIDEFTAALNLNPNPDDQANLEEHIAHIEKMKTETEDDQSASAGDESADDFLSERKPNNNASDDFLAEPKQQNSSSDDFLSETTSTGNSSDDFLSETSNTNNKSSDDFLTKNETSDNPDDFLSESETSEEEYKIDSKDGKTGVIDKRGRTLIPYEEWTISSYKAGIAKVLMTIDNYGKMLGCSCTAYKVGYVDKTGQFIDGYEISFSTGYPMDNSGLFLIAREPGQIITDEDRKRIRAKRKKEYEKEKRDCDAKINSWKRTITARY